MIIGSPFQEEQPFPTPYCHLVKLLLPENQQFQSSSWRLSVMFKVKPSVVMEAGEGSTCSPLLSKLSRSSRDSKRQPSSHYCDSLTFRLSPILTLLTHHWSPYQHHHYKQFKHVYLSLENTLNIQQNLQPSFYVMLYSVCFPAWHAHMMPKGKRAMEEAPRRLLIPPLRLSPHLASITLNPPGRSSACIQHGTAELQNPLFSFDCQHRLN